MKFRTGGEGLAQPTVASATASDRTIDQAARASPKTNRGTRSWYHALLRSARLAIWLLGACACSAAPKPESPITPSAAALQPSSPAKPPSFFERARGFPLANPAPFRSAHLGRAHWAQIRVNPDAAAAYLALGPDTAFEPGTLLVEWLRDEQTGRTGPTLALERRAEDWTFWVLRPDGVIETSETLEPCAGCHAAAPAAPVFGIPRDR